MSTAILIHKILNDKSRLTFFYNKIIGCSIENIKDIKDIVGDNPQLYLTGLGALNTQKRLAKKLKELDPLSTYITERVPFDDLQITAKSRIGHGRTPQKYNS